MMTEGNDARRARAICDAQGTNPLLATRAIEVIRQFECLEGYPDSSLVRDCDVALGRVEHTDEEYMKARQRIAAIVWDVTGELPDVPKGERALDCEALMDAMNKVHPMGEEDCVTMAFYLLDQGGLSLAMQEKVRKCLGVE